jgi:acyl carrier protein
MYAKEVLLQKNKSMERKDLLKEINIIFIDILDNEDLLIDENSTAKDVDEWDSLTHIQLVVAIEKKFHIRFTSREIQSWKNVGEMIDCIETRVA